MDEKTTYQILQSHGRLDLCLEYANVIHDYDTKFKNFINEGQYERAMDQLEMLKKGQKEKVEKIINMYSYILIKKVPSNFHLFTFFDYHSKILKIP